MAGIVPFIPDVLKQRGMVRFDLSVKGTILQAGPCACIYKC